MIKLVWTNWGANIALGVYAPTKAEVERIFNGCYNFGAVSQHAKLHILKDDENGTFGFFKTTWSELVKVADVPYIAKFLPKTQLEIDSMREDFLDETYASTLQD